jgi:hypothetical protein
MPLNYYPSKSIEIPKVKGLIIAEKDEIASFWSHANSVFGEELSEGIGCYIFSIRAGKGSKPWYVGLAQNQTFRKECFTDHKLKHYNYAIAERKGTPLLTLVVKRTPGSKIIGPTAKKHRDIEFLENMLIGNCLSRNPSLSNVRDTKLLKEMVVPGLFNTPQGKQASHVAEFRALIGSD